MEKAPFAKCDECPLKDQPAVQGQGPSQAEYVVVGEAPGKQEARTGIPFTGKSGQLMDKILFFHGIERKDVYVTNAVLCRPPDNRTPTAVELRCCRDRLIEEVKEHKPDRVIGLGAVASKTLLDTREGITNLRLDGPQWRDELGAHVVPTFHPAAALRNPDIFPSILNDVKRATQRIEVGWEPTKHEVYFDPYEATNRLMMQAAHANYNLISVDCEWAKPYDKHNPRWLCMAVSERPGMATVYTAEVMCHGGFQEMFENLSKNKVTRFLWQNGKSDIQYLWDFAPSAHVDEDTMLMHYSTDERKATHDLQQIVTTIFPTAPRWKTEAKEESEEGDSSLEYLPEETLYWYNAQDADYTYRAFDPLDREMFNDNVREMYHELLVPGANALAHVEYPGIRVDIDKLDKLEERYSQSLVEKEEPIHRWLANPRSPKQIKEAFEDIIGADVIPDTRKQTLENIIYYTKYGPEISELCQLLLDYKADQKIFSTYIKGMRKHIHDDGRIYSTFHLHVAETGRLSSRKPNLQNIPIGELRGIFIPDEGCEFVSADYSQIELRIGALEIESPWLIQAFAEERKIHHEVALSIFGEGYTKRQYVDGKAVTFGIIYDRQAPAIAAQLKISVKKAQAMIDMWKKRVPELDKYFERVRDEIKQKSYLTSRFGRKRRFWLITRDNMLDVFREGYNFKIQSPASDVTLRALIRIQKEAPWLNPRITVHDSIVFVVPIEHIEYAKTVITNIMEDNPDFEVPIPVDITVGGSWDIT